MKTSSQLEAKQIGCIRQERFLFADISFQLHPGQALIVEGSNGAGKSSLLRLLAGAATPAKGCILWNGKATHTALAEYAEQMHYLGHANGIRLGLTVAENLMLACELSQAPHTNLDEVLSLLQLSEHKNTQAQFLSAGQKRRVALARLFLMPRALWILDEPFTALDTHTQQTLLDKIEKHLKDGGICVMTSHQPITLSGMPIQHLRLAA